MCGIVGTYNPRGLPENFQDKELLKRMTLSMHHRGPDEKGVLCSDTAYLGHARLSIIDIETGRQPMYSEEYNIAVVFNGEIFNYLELRDDLKSKGYRFHTQSDTETLPYLYREYGAEMVQKLNGQFAFALIDFNENKMFAARDRIGIRPLFYTFVNDTLIFSSCIRTILMRPEVRAEFDYKTYHQMVHIWTPYGDATFFKNIHGLRPGEYLEYSTDRMRKAVYWDLAFHGPEDLPEAVWKERVSEALTRAVALRMRADVPVNAYLSGGLDSSIILELVRDIHKGELESFSVGFTDKSFDETRYQELMNRQTRVKNSAVTISPQAIGAVFTEIIRHSEQPVFRTAPAPLYYLSKLVRDRGFKVVVTGEGADEISWGYNIFKETLIRYNLAKDPGNQEWMSKISLLYPYLKQFDKKYLGMLTGFYSRSAAYPDSPLFSHRVRIANGKNLLNFINPDIRELMAGYDVEADIIPTLPEDFGRWSPLQKCQYLEMKTMLAGYLLSSQGDRMSMAHSVEGRYPFLDHNVVELFAKMPDHLKLDGMNEKYILKQTFRDRLPCEIAERSKYPYRAPEAVSLLSDGMAETCLNESVVNEQNFFLWKYVSRLGEKIRKNRGNVSFNDNFAYVNIAGTTLFLSLMKQGFLSDPACPDGNMDIHEMTLG